MIVKYPSIYQELQSILNTVTKYFFFPLYKACTSNEKRSPKTKFFMNLKITSSTPQENNNEILQLIKIKQNTHALFQQCLIVSRTNEALASLFKEPGFTISKCGGCIVYVLPCKSPGPQG